MLKKIICLLMVISMSLLLGVSALADDDVTIPINKSAKGATDLKKAVKADEPELDIHEFDGDGVKFWIWRKSAQAQVTQTYTFTSTGEKTIKYNNSGNKAKNEYYHAVWARTNQPMNTTVYVHFSFLP